MRRIPRSWAVRTLDEVGMILGLDRERVRQIEERALHKLRVRLRADRAALLEELAVKGKEYYEHKSSSDSG